MSCELLRSLKNILFAYMAAFTRHSSLALGLAVWSQAVSWALTSAQFTSSNSVSGRCSDNEIPVLCKYCEFSSGGYQLDTLKVWYLV